jgi:hypothetical protein
MVFVGGEEKTDSQVKRCLGYGAGEEGQRCELFGGAVLMRLAWGRQHESAR